MILFWFFKALKSHLKKAKYYLVLNVLFKLRQSYKKTTEECGGLYIKSTNSVPKLSILDI